MRLEKTLTRFRMRRNTLQQGQRIAHAIRLLRRQRGRINGKVDGDNLLKQRRNGAERVPQHGRQIVNVLAFLG